MKEFPPPKLQPSINPSRSQAKSLTTLNIHTFHPPNFSMSTLSILTTLTFTAAVTLPIHLQLYQVSTTTSNPTLPYPYMNHEYEEEEEEEESEPQQTPTTETITLAIAEARFRRWGEEQGWSGERMRVEREAFWEGTGI